MKNILTVMKKEILRVAKDRRLIFSLLLPGLLIFAMYSLMGDAISNIDSDAQDAVYSIVAVRMPNDVQAVLDLDALELSANYTHLDDISDEEIEQKLQSIKDEALDILIIFEEGFAPNLNSSDKSEVKIYYNPAASTSSYAYSKVSSGMRVYTAILLENEGVDVVPFVESVEGIYDEKSATAQMFAMLIPFLMMSFLFSASISVTPDAIAGEKERGTIATILITPIKRSELALGKIFALSVLASFSALSSFLGLVLSLPKLMGDDVSMSGLYGMGEYLLILLVLLSTVLLIVGLMAVVSSYAKTVKEASMLVMPLMLISMGVGLVTMFEQGAYSNPALYLVPLLNSTQSLAAILTFEISIVNLLLTFVANTVVLGACIFGLTRLFNNERVMFSK